MEEDCSPLNQSLGPLEDSHPADSDTRACIKLNDSETGVYSFGESFSELGNNKKDEKTQVQNLSTKSRKLPKTPLSNKQPVSLASQESSCSLSSCGNECIVEEVQLESLYMEMKPNAFDNKEYMMCSKYTDGSCNNETQYLSDVFEDECFEEVKDHINESLLLLNENGQNDEFTNSVSKEETLKNKTNLSVYVINEFVDTEEGYLRDLNTIVDDIMKSLSEKQLPEAVKVETIFENIEIIRNFSVSFVKSLRATLQDSTNKNSHIPKVFMEHAEELKRVYISYCRNYDNSNDVIQKCKSIPEFQRAVDECLDNAKSKLRASDLGSLLIKPVQRVLRYPLLLRELLKTTPQPMPGEDASYYQEIVEANKIAENISKEIDQAKRAYDLVKKYRLNTYNESDRLTSGNLVHGIVKKTKRAMTLINLAINNPTVVDNTFREIEQLYKSLERAIGTSVKNCEQFLSDYEEVLRCDVCYVEQLVDFYEPNQTPMLTSYAAAAEKIARELFPDFKSNVQQHIITPLTELSLRLKEPEPIIAKRTDKWLDYENCLRNSDSTERIETAQNIYEALNQQLLDEIPKLCMFSSKILDACLMKLVQLQIEFLRNSVQVVEESLKLFEGSNPSFENQEKMEIVKSFNSMKNRVLLEMQAFTILPVSFAAKAQMDQRGNVAATVQTCNKTLQLPVSRQRLFERYKQSDLYMVVADYQGNTNTELVCSRGQILGVIKRHDLAGNRYVWFCDNGVAQGNFPSSLLHCYAGLNPVHSQKMQNFVDPQNLEYSSRANHYISLPYTRSSQSSPNSSHPSPYSIREGLYGEVEGENVYETCDEIDSDLLNDVFQAEEDMLDDSEYDVVRGTLSGNQKIYSYIVKFSFTARSPLELSVTKNELVNVIIQHDANGSSDWWLVANQRGKQGYVPNNFIRKV